MKPTVQALFGLLASVSNFDKALLGKRADVATDSGNAVTLTTAQVLTGFINLTTGATGGFTITLPTTANIITAFGTIPTDGTYTKVLAVLNNAIGQTGTLTAGDADTTFAGSTTDTIATSVTRLYLLTVTSKTTITLCNIGALTL